jgi:hypothetical protein
MKFLRDENGCAAICPQFSSIFMGLSPAFSFFSPKGHSAVLAIVISASLFRGVNA